MKRIALLLAFGFMASASFAQSKGKDYITLKQDGKMYWMRSGQNIKLAIPVPLKNGAFAYPDGSIKSKEGDISKLAQGDKIMMDGTVVTRKSKQGSKN